MEGNTSNEVSDNSNYRYTLVLFTGDDFQITLGDSQSCFFVLFCFVLFCFVLCVCVCVCVIHLMIF